MTVSYWMRDGADGQVEVVEHREAVIGTFAQAGHARRFFEMLAGTRPDREAEDGGPAAALPQDACRPVGNVSPALPPCSPPQALRAEADVRKAVLASVRAAKENLPPGPPAEVSKEKPKPAVAPLDAAILEQAFDRIERGEKIQAVADDLGVEWRTLRGAYAGWKGRRQRQGVSSDKAECGMCGKEFMPSASSPDACARCAREMER